MPHLEQIILFNAVAPCLVPPHFILPQRCREHINVRPEAVPHPKIIDTHNLGSLVKIKTFRSAMSISPPTPSRAFRDDERRFKTITLPCEWVEDYRPGGYHPVVIGDVFNNSQYKVIRKLGEGSYSTVWLAHDLK